MSANFINNKIISNVIWKSLERFFSQGVSLVISIILARILSPDDYGIIAMILVFISLADVFVQSGFATALIQKKNANDVDFSTMFYCSLLSSIFIYFILYYSSPYISSYYTNENLTLYMRIFALKIPFSVLNSIQHAYVSRHMLFKLFFGATLIGTISSGLIGILLAYKGYGAWALIVQYISNTIINTIILLFIIPWRPKLLFSINSAKSLMNYGWKILCADFSGTFFGQLRNLIIGRYYTSSDLAFYSRGQQIPSIIYNNIGTAIMTVLFPAISNYSDDIIRVKQITRKSMSIISYILIPLLSSLAALSPQLIPLLLTDKWNNAIPFAQIMCLCYAIAVLGIAPFQAIKAIGYSDVILKLEFIKKPIFIILLIIGVKISVLAVAQTMIVYELYGILINSVQIKKYLNYKYYEQLRDVLPSLLLSLPMCLTIYIVNIDDLGLFLNVVLKSCFGFLTLIILSVIFKVNSFKDVILLIERRK